MVVGSSFELLIALGISRGQLRDDVLVLTVIGFVPYVFAHEQLNRAFWSYLGEIQAGVLEQTYLTPLPSWALVLGRQVVAVIAGLTLAAAVALAGLVTLGIRHGSLPFDRQILLPLGAIVVGTTGYGLALSGLTLVFKRLEIVPTVVISVWFVAGGGFVPLNAMPARVCHCRAGSSSPSTQASRPSTTSCCTTDR
jgi:ABC-2 type transport system permease protein